MGWGQVWFQGVVKVLWLIPGKFPGPCPQSPREQNTGTRGEGPVRIREEDLLTTGICGRCRIWRADRPFRAVYRHLRGGGEADCGGASLQRLKLRDRTSDIPHNFPRVALNNTRRTSLQFCGSKFLGHVRIPCAICSLGHTIFCCDLRVFFTPGPGNLAARRNYIQRQITTTRDKHSCASFVGWQKQKKLTLANGVIA